MDIVGRKKEIGVLDTILSSKQAEFVVVYGRRRVGKTYLVQQYFSQKGLYLECTGLKDGTLTDQLANFTKSFSTAFYPGLLLQQPKNWREAFELLTTEIKKGAKNKKIIVFLDELPWLASPKSELLQNLDYFWNTQWNQIQNFKLIVCGSAASWILNNLINAKGGLYNRITRSILLEPFSLSETKEFLIRKKIKLAEKDILDLYMVMGGIPYYLNHLETSKSLSQNINDLCFKKDGLLYNEFPRLFRSLFESAELNLKIVKAIAKKRYGVSFSELVLQTGKKAGGRFQERLNELEATGFIQRFLPYGRKKRDHHYRVIDSYTLFYLKWIEELVDGKSIPRGADYWARLSKSPSWLSWAGHTFENVCYSHIDKIISALGLGGIGCLVSHWKYKAIPGENESGAEIDLLLDRDDGAITLCEIKYTTSPFVIDKSYAKNLANKMDVFEKNTKQRKQLFLVMITTMGIKKNLWSEDLINSTVELKDLF